MGILAPDVMFSTYERLGSKTTRLPAAHIFCTEEQIISETSDFCKLLMEVYADFGFEDVVIKFSDRPLNRAGSDKIWDRAEKSLINAVEKAG